MFLQDTPDKDVIRRIHTANTEVVGQDGSSQIVRYYSLWTNDDARLTASGKLLRSEYYPEKYSDMQNKGADVSYEISPEHLASYDANQLASLTSQLEKFLKPRED